ncbi:hypothetical protein FRC03_009816 [Tulasnella sp. 419]|nr:hypothetical protein FRC03_009816 [Tulasnella sp. 419]
MVSWQDPNTIAAHANAFNKLMFVNLGLYIWEMLCTMKYDFSVFSGRRKFKWPMTVYFICRYTLIFSIIGVISSLNIKTKVNCQAMYLFNQITGNITIGSASTLLMLRTIAIWSRKLYIVIPLGLLALGQWAILFYGVFTIRARWSDEAQACVIFGTYALALNLIYIYTMAYDLVVLVLSIIGLIKTASRSDLWELLFKDGLAYFFVAFTSNTIPAVFLILNLNQVMNIIFTVPAATASTIVACRGFVRLANWGNQDRHISNFTQRLSRFEVAKPSQSHHDDNYDLGSKKGSKPRQDITSGVHISTQTFTITDQVEYVKDLDPVDETEVSTNDGRSERSTKDYGSPSSPSAPKITFSRSLNDTNV